MPWRCWSRRSFHVAWTSATHSVTACPIDWWPGCSLSRMLRYVWCRALDGMTTSRRCYTSGTGFQFGNGKTAPWSTVRCPAWLRLAWPLTVSWSLTRVVVSCVLPTRGLVSSGGPTATFETDVSRLLARSCETVLQLVLRRQTLATNSLNGDWRLCCFGVRSWRTVTNLLNLRLSKFSYLLISYLLGSSADSELHCSVFVRLTHSTTSPVCLQPAMLVFPRKLVD